MTGNYFDQVFGGLGKPSEAERDMKVRIVKLEEQVHKHKLALTKANELLKECINRIQKLEGR